MSANLFENRSLKGYDVESWRAMYRLRVDNAVFALALSGRDKLKKLTASKEVVPFDVEFLIRMYIDSPQMPAVFNCPTLIEFMQELYAPLFEAHQSEEEVKKLRFMLKTRFALMLGRSTSTGYRWLDDAEKYDGRGGSGSRIVFTIISKALEIDKARRLEYLENMATKVWALRGFNFHEMYQLKGMQKRGRKAGQSVKNATLIDKGAERLLVAHASTLSKKKKGSPL